MDNQDFNLIPEDVSFTVKPKEPKYTLFGLPVVESDDLPKGEIVIGNFPPCFKIELVPAPEQPPVAQSEYLPISLYDSLVLYFSAPVNPERYAKLANMMIGVDPAKAGTDRTVEFVFPNRVGLVKINKDKLRKKSRHFKKYTRMMARKRMARV